MQLGYDFWEIFNNFYLLLLIGLKFNLCINPSTLKNK